MEDNENIPLETIDIPIALIGAQVLEEQEPETFVCDADIPCPSQCYFLNPNERQRWDEKTNFSNENLTYIDLFKLRDDALYYVLEAQSAELYTTTEINSKLHITHIPKGKYNAWLQENITTVDEKIRNIALNLLYQEIEMFSTYFPSIVESINKNELLTKDSTADFRTDLLSMDWIGCITQNFEHQKKSYLANFDTRLPQELQTFFITFFHRLLQLRNKTEKLQLNDFSTFSEKSSSRAYSPKRSYFDLLEDRSPAIAGHSSWDDFDEDLYEEKKPESFFSRLHKWIKDFLRKDKTSTTVEDNFIKLPSIREAGTAPPIEKIEEIITVVSMAEWKEEVLDFYIVWQELESIRLRLSQDKDIIRG